MRLRALPTLAASIVIAVLLTAAPGATGADSGSLTASVLVSPLTVDLDLSTYATEVGGSVRARAIVGNVGASTIDAVVVALRLDPAGVVIRNGTTRVIRRLRTGRAASSSWSFCPTLPGTYVVLARAKTELIAIDSPARLLAVQPSENSC